jgi:hypothetical protein
MKIKRQITQYLIDLAKQFSAIAVLGPVNRAKQLLLKKLFPIMPTLP